MKYNILKYSNRKLYLKEESRYITMLDVIKLISTGRNEISVIDQKNKEDITAQTMVKALSDHVQRLSTFDKLRVSSRILTLVRGLPKDSLKEESVLEDQ